MLTSTLIASVSLAVVVASAFKTKAIITEIGNNLPTHCILEGKGA